LVSAVRIPDLPDLGEVTDSAAFVGEAAGSGKFLATALLSYIRGAGGVGDPVAIEAAARLAADILLAAADAAEATARLAGDSAAQTALAALSARIAAIEANYVKTD
jgi:hypothetical protein